MFSYETLDHIQSSCMGNMVKGRQYSAYTVYDA